MLHSYAALRRKEICGLYQRGMPLEEIARCLGCHVSTVRVQLSKGGVRVPRREAASKLTNAELAQRIAIVRSWKTAMSEDGEPGNLSTEVLERILP